jgi:hypothetical protein
LITSFAAAQSIHAADQAHFSAEDDQVQHPVPIPEPIFRFLIEQVDVKDQGTPEEIRKWLSVAEVHLAGPNEIDWVVYGGGGLGGANVSPFWIFVPNTEEGHRLVMHDSAHNLDFLRGRSNGYRDINLTSLTCCELSETLLKYDGRMYKAARARLRKL